MEQTVVECTTIVAKHTASSYTMVAMEKTAVTVVQIMVDTAVAVSPSIGVLIHSYSMYLLSFLGVGHMLDNPSLHG